MTFSPLETWLLVLAVAALIAGVSLWYLRLPERELRMDETWLQRQRRQR